MLRNEWRGIFNQSAAGCDVIYETGRTTPIITLAECESARPRGRTKRPRDRLSYLFARIFPVSVGWEGRPKRARRLRYNVDGGGFCGLGALASLVPKSKHQP